MLPKIGPEIETITRKVILERFKEHGVKLLTNHKLSKITEDGVCVINNEGKERFLEGDCVIIAVGNRPDDHLYEEIQSLDIEAYQVGDCLTARSAKEAISEGASLGRSL
jgi:NADH dehydrogenase FAD-containing subunit